LLTGLDGATRFTRSHADADLTAASQPARSVRAFGLGDEIPHAFSPLLTAHDWRYSTAPVCGRFRSSEGSIMADAIRSAAIALILGVLALFVLAVGLFVLLSQYEGHSTIGGRQVIVRTPPLGGLGVGDGASTGKPMNVRVGGHSVVVSADEIDVVGVKKVVLTPDCKKIEIVQAIGGVQVLLDGVEVK
jgi:hypothetical protein